jgi:fatty-acyl-CoA synthase
MGGPDRLIDRIRHTAMSRREAPALTFLDGRLQPSAYTFGELLDAADLVARRLARTPLEPGSPVGILLRTQEEQVLHYLGALDAGLVPAILTPPNRKLNAPYYAETMAAVLARSGFAAVVTDLEDIAAGYPTLIPGSLERSGPWGTRTGEPVEGRVSFMQFSSGTTGIKRGVLVSDEAVITQLATYGEAIRLSAEDVILSWLPLYHDMGFIAALNLPLAAGVHSVMIEPVDWVTNPSLFLQAASDYRATVSWNPNFAYAFMAQRVRDRHLRAVDLSAFRALVNCSEPVTFQAQQLFAERFGAHKLRPDVFRGCYAMAETVFALTHGDPTDPCFLDTQGPAGSAYRKGQRTYVSVGRPLRGVELRVVDELGHDLPDRHIGELFARSPFNLSGYYRNPEATEKAFAGEWYRTGDLGYCADGAFYVVGRSKDLLIIGGVNVFPEDIERLVGGIPGVKAGRVSAFAEFDEQQQTEQVVVLAESDKTGADADALLMEGRQRIQSAFLISGFKLHLVEPGWLVKSTSGKMARAANRKKWTQ